MGRMGGGSLRLPVAARGGAILLGLIAAVFVPPASAAQGQSVRARDLGIPFEGLPGPLNAITDRTRPAACGFV